MHILELPSYFPPHGGLFCLEQAKALMGRGHEVRILSCVQLGITIDGWQYFTTCGRPRWHEMDGVPVYGASMHACPRLVRLNVWRWCRMVEKMLERYMQRYGRPDVVHAHCALFAGVAAYRLSLKYGIPYFITEHTPSNLFYQSFGEGWTRSLWLKRLVQTAYDEAQSVIHVAAEQEDDLAPMFGRSYPHRVVSNVIDTDFFSYHQRPALEGRPFRFCCLSVADVYRKGLDVLSQAMLQWQSPQLVELHLAGPGTDAASFQSLFSSCSNVYFHGSLSREGVRSLLYESDALVLASRSEAQPLVILEAMATGLPVVCTECVPAIERVEGACLVAPVGDAEKLRACMEQVCHIPPSPLYAKAVRGIVSPDVVAQQLEKVFANL